MIQICTIINTSVLNISLTFVLMVTYSCNKVQDRVISLHPNGKKKVVEIHRGDIKVKQLEYYESGVLKSDKEFKDSIQNGKYSFWYENESKRSEGLFINGLKQDTAYEFYKEGSLKNMRYYKDGTIMIYKKFNPDGSLIHDLNFVTQIFKFWHKNGQLKAIVPSEKGQHIDYYPNGKVQRLGFISDGKKNGKYYFFSEQGDTLKAINYEFGEAKDSIIWRY